MLFKNATIATMTNQDSYGLIECGALYIRDGKINWVGKVSEIPSKFLHSKSEDLEGRLVTPGLIDCHTHIVYGGNRSVEFEMRLNGASYEDVARAGGGIISTVSDTRLSSIEDLVKDSLHRVDQLISEGVTLIEVKSGYGLDRETELKMLKAARQIQSERPIRVVTTFLGAHAVPPEYKDDPDTYIDTICIPTLHDANSEGLVDSVDAFCENIAFNVDQVERVFQSAKKMGLPVKVHSEQLSHMGGTKLAADYRALSADHIEYANAQDAKALSIAGTVAVLLPGAFYTLRETQLPPLLDLRNEKVPIAIATDCNPGSSPLTSILLTMNMACTLFQMTPQETLAGVTKNAAKALGKKDSGTIEIGNRADLCIWDVKHPAELSYRIGFNPLHRRIFGGAV
ncbi:MAG: imidazolonepropionase [Paracoccaceae bacterium]